MGGAINKKTKKMPYGGHKRSANRAFGAIASSRFYGHVKKTKMSKGHSAKNGGRNKSKGAKSFTRTVAKKQSNVGNDSYGGGTNSYQKIALGPYKSPLSKGSAPVMIQSNSGVSLAVPVGQQGILLPAVTCFRNALQSWETIVTNNHRAQIGNAVATGIINVRVFIKYITTEHRIENLTIRPMEIEIYDYVYKRDSPDTLGTTFTNAVIYDNVGDRTDAPYQNAVSTLPGWKPTDSSPMNQYLKIVKRKKVWLQAGESHVHTVNTRYNKAWDPGMAATNAQVINYKGFTHGTFVIGMGCLSTGQTSGGGIVDIGSTEFGIFSIERVAIRAQMTGLKQTQQYKGNAPIVGTEQFVDEVIGGIFRDGTGIIAGLKQL